MKIALVSQEYPPETARGGIGSQTYIKAQGLSGLGHQVYVISRSLDSKRHERIDGNICVIRVPGLEDYIHEMTDPVQWITNSLVVSVEIEAVNKRIGLDLIDFPEWGAEGYIYLLNRTEWNRIPSVVQLHGPLAMFAHTMGWPEMDSEFYRVGTHMEATCVKLADAVYSSSKCSDRWIRSAYEFSGKDTPVIHSGVDTAVFSPRMIPKDDRPTIIFVGKAVLNKGVNELIEAAASLSLDFKGLRLRMVGSIEDSSKKKFYEKVDKLGAPGLLDLPGFIPKEDLPGELSRAHIFASPSYYEGGPGFVFLEAMACGLPVVGCSGSGIDEIVTSGENGILVPPRDTEALKQALKKILEDRKLREDMGRNAFNYISREADSRHCLKRLENFYNSVLQAGTTDLKVAKYD